MFIDFDVDASVVSAPFRSEGRDHSCSRQRKAKGFVGELAEIDDEFLFPVDERLIGQSHHVAFRPGEVFVDLEGGSIYFHRLRPIER